MQVEKERSSRIHIEKGREGTLCRQRMRGAALDILRRGEKEPCAGREGEEHP
jgi:hypothetical protein